MGTIDLGQNGTEAELSPAAVDGGQVGLGSQHSAVVHTGVEQILLCLPVVSWLNDGHVNAAHWPIGRAASRVRKSGNEVRPTLSTVTRFKERGSFAVIGVQVRVAVQTEETEWESLKGAAPIPSAHADNLACGGKTEEITAVLFVESAWIERMVRTSKLPTSALTLPLGQRGTAAISLGAGGFRAALVPS